MDENIIALTGDRPTGPLHLGHYMGSLLTRVAIQDKYRQFIMIADDQALTDNFSNPEKVTRNVFEIAADYISVGIDPSKNTVFIQSQVHQIKELMFYFMNLVNMGRLERNPTLKTEIYTNLEANKTKRQNTSYEDYKDRGTKSLGRNGGIPVGFLCYPISQAADIALFKAKIVPAGDDQVPMIEQTNEVVKRFNKIYKTNCLVQCKALLSTSPRLVGLDGKFKASKSLGNAIFLSDSKDLVRKKVFSMYTDPSHIKVSDPGKVEGNVVFTYLDVFYSNKSELEDLKKSYKKGGLGDVTIKEILNESLQAILEPIRSKRSEIKRSMIEEILRDGTSNALLVAKSTIEEVKDAIGISKYFYL